MAVHPEEARRWLRWLPDQTHDCPECLTAAVVTPLWADADREYRAQMDPTLHDGKPSLEVKARANDLALARQRRHECPRGHGEEQR